MAPLGEGSLEATILDGARGRPTPSHHLTSRWDKIFQPASDCPFAADPPIRAANGPRFTRIPRTTGGRAPGSRCARRGNAVVAGQTCGPGHPRGSRSQPRALRREGVRMRRVRTSTDAGTPGQIALAASSALVVHRSGSRVHAPIGVSSHSDVFIVVAPLHALRRRAAMVPNVANKPLQRNGLIENDRD